MGSPIVVMGVSGSGKSTVGAALAQRLRVPFADADDFHPPANIAKMTAGQPLDADDRHPWLETIGQWLVEHADGGVMSCSALKRKYRDQLRTHDPEVTFLYLAGTELDFSDGLNGKGFNFHNPNASRTCGCGESFSV